MKRKLVVLAVVLWSLSSLAQSACDGTGALTLERPARNWQFLDAVGPHAGLLGREDGTFEAWVYPLKLFRDFRLRFRLGDTVLPGEAIPRMIVARPESSAVKYIYDSFTACATWLAPVDQRGAIVEIIVDSAEPVAIEASFTPDVAWMWPAAVGDAYSQWDAQLKAFRFSNDHHVFWAIAGSAGATPLLTTYSANYSADHSDEFSFGPATKGHKVYRFAMAASFEGQKQADEAYAKLLADTSLLQQASSYYTHYLDNTVQLELPDEQLQRSYDWARISTVQGLVDEPFAGKGLVAGYNISSGSHRPGFSWYFGRDSMWTALALDSIGDYATTRTALEFLMQYQRPNGRIPHEIAQSVKLVDWWNDYPYGTASADGTPLFLVGFADYVRASGDVAFASEHWDNLWRAYQFLKTTYSTSGLSQNANVGHGWVEGGPLRPQPGDLAVPHDPPLVPIGGEFYQAGVGTAGVEALAAVARAIGKQDVAQSLEQEAAGQRATMEKTFWSAEKGYYAFAVDPQGKRIEKPSVLGTVPMWFGLTDAGKSDQLLNVIAAPDHQTDWGPRIISNKDPLYGPTGYHYGSVWPLFTGWAAVAGYRYHRPHYGYENLMANARLEQDGTPGRTTEVLSGDFYTDLSTSTPHQIWSSAMVISPILRGMMGLEVDTLNNTVTLAPHVPAAWKDFAIRNVKVGASQIDFAYHAAVEDVSLEIIRHGGAKSVRLVFSPAVSARTKIVIADVNGTKADPKITANAGDQHVTFSVPLTGEKTTIHFRVTGNFAIGNAYVPPVEGGASSGMKFVSREWSADRNRLTLQLAGIAGKSYIVLLFSAPSGISVEGATITKTPDGLALKVDFPAGAAGEFVTRNINLRFPAQ
jgi:glycogen debranching enzyme